MYFEDILWAYFVCYIDSHSLIGSFIIHIFSLKKWCKCDGMDVMASCSALVLSIFEGRDMKLNFLAPQTAS